MRELTEDSVKFAIAKRQLLDVGFGPLQIHVGDLRVRARPIKELRRTVCAFHNSSQPRSRDRDYSGATAGIEDSHSRLDSGKAHQKPRGRCCDCL